MKRQTGIERKVEDALNSLDGMQRAEPRDWFYTRVKAKLDSEEHTTWSSIGSFLSRPFVAVVTMGLVLLLNGFFLFSGNTTENNTNTGTSLVPGELNTDNEYVLASSSSYEFENIAQQ